MENTDHPNYFVILLSTVSFYFLLEGQFDTFYTDYKIIKSIYIFISYTYFIDRVNLTLFIQITKLFIFYKLHLSNK